MPLAWSLSPAYTAMCLWPHFRHDAAYWQPGIPQPPVRLQRALPLSAFPDSYHYLCVCNGHNHYTNTWSRSLHPNMCTPLALATRAACSEPNSVTWRHCWGHKYSFQTLWIPHRTHKGSYSCWCCGPQWSEPIRHNIPPMLDLVPPYVPTLGSPAPLDPGPHMFLHIPAFRGTLPKFVPEVW